MYISSGANPSGDEKNSVSDRLVVVELQGYNILDPAVYYTKSSNLGYMVQHPMLFCRVALVVVAAAIKPTMALGGCRPTPQLDVTMPNQYLPAALLSPTRPASAGMVSLHRVV